MALSGYYRFCMSFSRIGSLGKKMAEGNPEIDSILEKANKKLRGEVFYAGVLTASIIAFLSGLALVTLLNLVILPKAGVSLPIKLMLWILVPPLSAALIYMIATWLPRSKIKERKKDIDKNVSYATNYMAAMASADVTPSAIFRGLAQQDIYGEIKVESEKIARDIDFFGKDIVKVLQKGIARSPSEKFQDFLQGIITTAGSGGSLKQYFMAKSEQFMRENRLQQEKDLQTLGVMAESFVTVVVASPLFLIIMMSTMAMMGQSGGDVLLMATIFGLIPVAQIVFGVLIGDTGGGD
ncbi:MAG: type II secretion system F family protein [Candidatus Thermoplasmatota archaeon]|nr:type II secretion system F family protein [Candidatus Thermoplasmatota archaeon]